MSGLFRFVSLLVLFALPLTGLAVPVLQLGIGGGEYDSDTETIITADNTFTLYAYAQAQGNKAINLLDTYYISVALTPQTGPEEVPFGSFVFAGTTYDIDNMYFGNPPFEDMLSKDAHDLSSHGIYETFFIEIGFQFSNSMTTASVNTALDPGYIPTGNGTSLYYKAFTVDVSNMLPEFGLHFDLYNTKLRNGDTDVKNFAPFSHDAGTAPSSTPAPVPEPGSLMLLSILLLVLTRLARPGASGLSDLVITTKLRK